MKIIEQHHDRQTFPLSESAQDLRCGVEAAVPNLLWIVTDAPDVTAVVVAEADQLAEQVDVGFGVVGSARVCVRV
ncbi:MAG TPA: hypothetical protein VFO28_07990, partial [Burkholderiaceae bacterium]|nr:hypothetical protein [Burkholderiaceae bacterium]